jgi:hypothetical protein
LNFTKLEACLLSSNEDPDRVGGRAMLVDTALPALADTKYFIVRGTRSPDQVLHRRPVAKDMRIVRPGGVTCRTEAMSAIRTVKVCE